MPPSGEIWHHHPPSWSRNDVLDISEVRNNVKTQFWTSPCAPSYKFHSVLHAVKKQQHETVGNDGCRKDLNSVWENSVKFRKNFSQAREAGSMPIVSLEKIPYKYNLDQVFAITITQSPIWTMSLTLQSHKVWTWWKQLVFYAQSTSTSELNSSTKKINKKKSVAWSWCNLELWSRSCKVVWPVTAQNILSLLYIWLVTAQNVLSLLYTMKVISLLYTCSYKAYSLLVWQRPRKSHSLVFTASHWANRYTGQWPWTFMGVKSAAVAWLTHSSVCKLFTACNCFYLFINSVQHCFHVCACIRVCVGVRSNTDWTLHNLLSTKHQERERESERERERKWQTWEREVIPPAKNGKQATQLGLQTPRQFVNSEPESSIFLVEVDVAWQKHNDGTRMYPEPRCEEILYTQCQGLSVDGWWFSTWQIEGTRKPACRASHEHVVVTGRRLFMIWIRPETNVEHQWTV